MQHFWYFLCSHFYELMRFSGLSYLSTIPELVGPNFKVWRNQLDCVFTMLDLDYVLT
jgi:hypothetical protein